MLNVTVLATGSTGNCYTLTNGEAVIMLDCGLTFKKLHRLANFQLPTAIFVTHEHGDHAKAVKDYLKRGVDVCMTVGTMTALKLELHHRLLLMRPKHEVFFINKKIRVENFYIKHDAKEPCGFIIEDNDDRVLYLTDAREIPPLEGKFTKLLIEANHSEVEIKERMARGTLDIKQCKRIMDSHLSVEQVLDFLEKTDLSKIKEIWLIHLSGRHGNGEYFKELVEAMTGKTVYVANNEIEER